MVACIINQPRAKTHGANQSANLPLLGENYLTLQHKLEMLFHVNRSQQRWYLLFEDVKCIPWYRHLIEETLYKTHQLRRSWKWDYSAAKTTLKWPCM